MAKKNKSNLISNNEVPEKYDGTTVTSSKIGCRIILKTKTFIIIDKYGVNVKIKLPIQELVKYQVGDIYYL